MSDRVAVVLAAGMGTRMKTDLPKVLVEVCGRPMVEFVLDAVEAAGIDRTLVVVGYRAADVRRSLKSRDHLRYVEQTEQLGTGHAVQVCREHLLDHQGAVLVLTGDSPLVQADSLKTLLDLFERERPACIMGTGHRDDPTGFGRIVRDGEGNFSEIVEEKDATPGQREITEVNLSTYVFDGPELLRCLTQIENNNRQREFYITDGPSILRAEGKDVRALPVLQSCEALSINTLEDLALVEVEMRRMGYGK